MMGNWIVRLRLLPFKSRKILIETSLTAGLSLSKLSFEQVVEVSGKLTASKEADQQISAGAIVEITFTSAVGETFKYKVETQEDGTYQLLPSFTPR